MKTLDFFPLVDQGNCQPSTLAILSGEIIYIIYPNGTVEMTTTENIHQNPTQHNLKTCVVWGRFEEF